MILWILFGVAVSVHSASGTCFFPVEYQGIYATQSTLTQGNLHRYSEITVLPDGIPIWGLCRRRMGNTVILHDSTGGQQCMRCFHLYLRSPNVIQVYTEGIDRCYENQTAAIDSCPSLQDIRSLKAREIMLYKSQSFNQDGRISRVMCPFVGRYHFSYGAFDGKRRSDMCLDLSSHLSSCPRASQLKLNFRDCTFGNLDLNLECLGSWTGLNDVNYLALFDPEVKSEQQPRYRCAMYHESESGRVSLSLSVDSSCHRQLVSPWQGFESLNLTPFRTPSPPSAVYGRNCVFPEWMQGDWQDIKIKEGKLEFRDETTDEIHSALCLSSESPSGERFTLYSVNQCGKESFRCVWIKSRSDNVMEFVMSTGEDNFNTTSLCSDDRFWNHGWITQGRKIRTNARCPISGEFVGILPDDKSLCAKLASDCESPHYMHYTVFPCNNDTVPYEDQNWDDLSSSSSLLRSVSKRSTGYQKTSLIKREAIPTAQFWTSSGNSERQPTPPWTYLGASERNNRFYILSSRPIDDTLDLSAGNLVYVFDSDIRPNKDKIEDLPRAGRLTDKIMDRQDMPTAPTLASNHVPDNVQSPSGRVTSTPGYTEDRRIKRNGYNIPPGKEKERYYQCLGQWEEGGVTYTYTWRRDVHKHECFAGVGVSNDEVFISEAGSTCRRGMQPLGSGMKIIKMNTCTELAARRNYFRGLETNEITESYQKSFGGRGAPVWNALGDIQLQLTSGGRGLDGLSTLFLFSLIIFKIITYNDKLFI